MNRELPDVQAGFSKGSFLIKLPQLYVILILGHPWKAFSQLERFAKEFVLN